MCAGLTGLTVASGREVLPKLPSFSPNVLRPCLGVWRVIGLIMMYENF